MRVHSSIAIGLTCLKGKGKGIIRQFPLKMQWEKHPEMVLLLMDPDYTWFA